MAVKVLYNNLIILILLLFIILFMTLILFLLLFLILDNSCRSRYCTIT
jgi:hypothetical protein